MENIVKRTNRFLKYIEWNELLCDYFFFQKDPEYDIFLSIDKDKLIELALPEFEKRCNKDNEWKNYTQQQKEDVVWKDFIRIFHLKDHDYKTCLKYFLEGFTDKINCYKKSKKDDEPQVFPYITLFIIALTSSLDKGEDIPNESVFYDKINEFLKSNYLINKDEKIKTKTFSDMKDELNDMWNSILKLANSNGYRFKVKTKVKTRLNQDRNSYARPFLSQIIFTPSQRNKFKIVFYKARLTAHQDITDEQVKEIMGEHYKHLGISEKRWTDIKYEDAILSTFRNEYDKWDGVAYTRSASRTEKRTEYLGVNQSLIMLAKNGGHKGDKIHVSFYLKAKLDDAELFEDYSYISKESGCYNFSVNSEKMADREISIDENGNIRDKILTNSPVEYTRKDYPDIKLIYHPTEIEILESSYDEYISSKNFKAGIDYLVLIRKQQVKDYIEWLDQNNAKDSSEKYEYALSDKFDLYKIHAKQDLSTSRIRKLHFDEIKKASLVDTISWKNDDDSYAICLCNSLPAYFEVTSIDVKDEIYAVFNSEDGYRDNCKLEYDHSNIWKLSPIERMRNKNFQLYHNDKPILSGRNGSSYKFVDFKALSEYQELNFNKYGEIDEAGIFKGLLIEEPSSIRWDELYRQMQSNGSDPQNNDKQYENTDYLLYYLSVQPKIYKEDFKYVRDILIRGKDYGSKEETKWAVKNLLDNYFRMGYCNYAYYKEEKKFVIAVNKPTFILLPPKIRRIEEITKRIEQTQKFWTVLVTGARTPKMISDLKNKINEYGKTVHMIVEPSIDGLLPQTIYLQFQSPIEKINDFAKQNGYDFQQCIYSNSLFDKIASVKEYEEYVTSGDELEDGYDTITDCECIDTNILNKSGYIAKAKEFNKNAAVVNYFPKTYREVTIIWKNGKQYDADKHWGNFVGIKYAGEGLLQKIVHYDEKNYIFKAPQMLLLPKLYERALTLMSGCIPSEKKGIRTYDFCLNPFCTLQNGKKHNASNFQTIINKLS